MASTYTLREDNPHRRVSTVSRPDTVVNSSKNERGGLSGPPLKNLSTEITDESTPNPPYPVHSMRKSGATIIPAPTVRYKVKKESSLVRSMENKEKTTSVSALNVDKKPVITDTAWL